MATKAYIVNGAEFAPNNYDAILEKTRVDAAFHLTRDLLRVSKLEFALTNSPVDSETQVLEFWQTAQFDDGGDTGTPSILFTHDGDEKIVTCLTVRDALHIPAHDFYTVLV